MRSKPLTVGDIGEFALLDRLLPGRTKATPLLPVGIGDDAAVFRLPDRQWGVATVDSQVEGVHFRLEWSTPAEVGQKLLTINCSDIAAMGGRPFAALLSMGLPPATPVKFVEDFYRGLSKACAAAGIELAGGDTCQTPVLTFTLALIGTVRSGRVLRLIGARPDDVLLVTGTLGDSALGLELLQSGVLPRSTRRNAEKTRTPRSSAPSAVKNLPLIRHHLNPMCPWQKTLELFEHFTPTAATDISDGLRIDLENLCHYNELGAEVDTAALPVSVAAKRWCKEQGWKVEEWALRGGEDYQFLFTLPPGKVRLALEWARAQRLPLTAIGHLTARRALRWLGTNLTELEPKDGGYEHFR